MYIKTIILLTIFSSALFSEKLTTPSKNGNQRIESLQNFIENNNFKIETLKITVRLLTTEDIEIRKLPSNTSGLVITNIEKDSPINYLNINNIIVEAQKKKVKSPQDLEKIINDVLKSSEKTMLIAIYNNDNQRRYIGVKLD